MKPRDKIKLFVERMTVEIGEASAGKVNDTYFKKTDFPEYPFYSFFSDLDDCILLMAAEKDIDGFLQLLTTLEHSPYLQNYSEMFKDLTSSFLEKFGKSIGVEIEGKETFFNLLRSDEVEIKALPIKKDHSAYLKKLENACNRVEALDKKSSDATDYTKNFAKFRGGLERYQIKSSVVPSATVVSASTAPPMAKKNRLDQLKNQLSSFWLKAKRTPVAESKERILLKDIQKIAKSASIVGKIPKHAAKWPDIKKLIYDSGSQETNNPIRLRNKAKKLIDHDLAYIAGQALKGIDVSSQLHELKIKIDQIYTKQISESSRGISYHTIGDQYKEKLEARIEQTQKYNNSNLPKEQQHYRKNNF